jgi:hypothetical protein
MKTLIVVGVVVVVLALPAVARGGCWATVQLSSAPNGLRAGDVWRVDLTVKQHGRTLLRDARPTVTVRAPGGGTRVVAARKTTRVGVYRAAVVFPRAGRWSYTIFDGFVPSCGREHSYPPLTIRP